VRKERYRKKSARSCSLRTSACGCGIFDWSRGRARGCTGTKRIIYTSSMAMKDGDVRYRELDGEDVHEALNVGDGPWRNIIVELKK
jgi:hypothetical protein